MTLPTNPEVDDVRIPVGSIGRLRADRRSCALLGRCPRRLPRSLDESARAMLRGGTEISPDRRAGRIRPPCASPIAAIEQILHSWLGNFKEAEGGCPHLLNHSSPP
jgi:hypothetical protein